MAGLLVLNAEFDKLGWVVDGTWWLCSLAIGELLEVTKPLTTHNVVDLLLR